MSFNGNLKDFSVAQLINLINLAKKTGLLTIESAGRKAEVAFNSGNLVYANINGEDTRLPNILRKNNKITHRQYQLLNQKAGQMSDKELGLLLINADYVSHEEIITCYRDYFSEIVRDLFAWLEGMFSFDNDYQVGNGRILVKMELENLIIEGVRQIREWEQLQEEIPSLDMALRFVERPGRNLRKLNLSMNEWKVIKFINPNNSMKQIAAKLNLNEMEIRRIVYSLLQAGLIEIIHVGGVSVKITPNMFPTEDREEQKSLLNRIIDRIRSI